MRAAALQFCPVFMQVDANLNRIENFLSSCDAELLVLPELCTTGYFFHDATQLAGVAETQAGATAQMLREAAFSGRRTIVAGFAEIDGRSFFNSAITAMPDGNIDVYRKTHLFAEEKLLFAPGDTGFRVVDIGAMRLGVMICYDWRFPEAARTLALKGAQVIAHPSDLVAAPELWQPAMRVRSLENRVFTVTADRNGSEKRGEEILTFHGCSQIVAPSGKVLAETGEHEEGWIVADLDLASADRKAFSKWNDIMKDRRPESYEM